VSDRIDDLDAEYTRWSREAFMLESTNSSGLKLSEMLRLSRRLAFAKSNMLKAREELTRLIEQESQ
jgi:hypothetical protein